MGRAGFLHPVGVHSYFAEQAAVRAWSEVVPNGWDHLAGWWISLGLPPHGPGLVPSRSLMTHTSR